MDVHVGDILEMKKPHPCGCKEFLLLRVGMDFKITDKLGEEGSEMKRGKIQKILELEDKVSPDIYIKAILCDSQEKSPFPMRSHFKGRRGTCKAGVSPWFL